MHGRGNAAQFASDIDDFDNYSTSKFGRGVAGVERSEPPVGGIAVESSVGRIVTHNVGHLQPATRLGVEILKPAAFLSELRGRS